MEVVDRPTQLIYIGISICQHTSKKDIAGQSARCTQSSPIILTRAGITKEGHSWREAFAGMDSSYGLPIHSGSKKTQFFTPHGCPGAIFSFGPSPYEKFVSTK